MLDAARLEELADSYLDHILIIVRVKNWGANVRDLLDSWWSLSRGAPFVRDNDNPSQFTMNNPCACGCEHKDRLRALDWVSNEADKALRRGSNCKNKMNSGGRDLRGPSDRLIVDHAVPLIQVQQIIKSRDDWDRSSLRHMLSHHLKRGLLTKAEDNRLTESWDGRSLRSDMPQGWEPYGDPFARYHARGIEPFSVA